MGKKVNMVLVSMVLVALTAAGIGTYRELKSAPTTVDITGVIPASATLTVVDPNGASVSLSPTTKTSTVYKPGLDDWYEREGIVELGSDGGKTDIFLLLRKKITGERVAVKMKASTLLRKGKDFKVGNPSLLIEIPSLRKIEYGTGNFYDVWANKGTPASLR
ncbi:MAG: hypothetical protein WC548_02250 [Candidatus Pacearchaeota archaeon]